VRPLFLRRKEETGPDFGPRRAGELKDRAGARIAIVDGIPRLKYNPVSMITSIPRGHRAFLTGVLVFSGLNAPPVTARADGLSNPAPTPRKSVVQQMDDLLGDPAVKGGIVGAEVVDLSTGEAVYRRNETVRLMPASNRKLFTAATALAVLGDDYRFQTTASGWEALGADGVLPEGICLTGCGDAALSRKDLDALADQAYRAGVRRIAGNVYGDGTCFTPGEEYGAGWGWDYLSDDYAAAVAGLEVDDGDFVVDITGSDAGDRPKVALDPPVTTIPVVNIAVSAAGARTADLAVTREWDRDAVTVSGQIAPGAHVRQTFSVAGPVRFAAECFRLALIRRGIAVDGHAVALSGSLRGMHVIASVTSEPMSKYLALMLKPSDNLIAESLMRVVGLQKEGKGDYETGRRAEIAFLNKIGISEAECDLADGSGVSRRNNVTADAVCRLLAYLAKQTDFPDFYADLPIAGVDGTLRRRLQNSGGAQIHAKTGSLTGACALSGYYTDGGGKRYAFSLLFNNYPGKIATVRAIQDRVVTVFLTGF
jgi:D-alanyl-D-alanine carboxypeptidase/D-alanyl-D-alanine-endopeptidase (penicillin-binding protein 4)